MKSKFLIGVAPVLAVAAFMLAPAGAQGCTAPACPHYYVNGAKIKEGEANKKFSIGWGNITLTGTEGSILGGHITCHNAAAGYAFNPTGGGAGEGKVTQFAPFSCEQTLICPSKTTFVEVVAEHLPWPDLLIEEPAGVFRQETGPAGETPKVDIRCFEGTVKIADLFFKVGLKKGSLTEPEKGQRPKAVEGTEALHPGFVEFDAESGELELEGSAGKVRGKTEGAVKTLGYNAQELIAVKNP